MDWANQNTANNHNMTTNNNGSAPNPLGMNMDMGEMGGSINNNASLKGSFNTVSSDEEPPLLEELGINFDHIKQKVLSTLNPTKAIDSAIVQDSDLAGPLLFCVALGVLLVLRGRLHFDYIYHFFVFGSLFIYIVLKLLAHHDASGTHPEATSSAGVDVLRVFSVLGYSLLPIVLLAAASLLLNLQAWYGSALVILMILWSTYTYVCSVLVWWCSVAVWWM